MTRHRLTEDERRERLIALIEQVESADVTKLPIRSLQALDRKFDAAEAGLVDSERLSTAIRRVAAEMSYREHLHDMRALDEPVRRLEKLAEPDLYSLCIALGDAAFVMADEIYEADMRERVAQALGRDGQEYYEHELAARVATLCDHLALAATAGDDEAYALLKRIYERDIFKLSRLYLVKLPPAAAYTELMLQREDYPSMHDFLGAPWDDMRPASFNRPWKENIRERAAGLIALVDEDAGRARREAEMLLAFIDVCIAHLTIPLGETPPDREAILGGLWQSFIALRVGPKGLFEPI